MCSVLICLVLVGGGDESGHEGEQEAEDNDQPFGEAYLVLFGAAFVEYGCANLQEGARYDRQTPGKDVLYIAYAEFYPFGEYNGKGCDEAEECCDEEDPGFGIAALQEHTGEQHGFRQFVQCYRKKEGGQYGIVVVGNAKGNALAESVNAQSQYKTPLYRL